MTATSSEHRMSDEASGGGQALRPGYSRPISSPVVRSSRIHFDVNTGLPEVVAYVRSRGWVAQGFSDVSVAWQELHWTTDGWRTVHRLSSHDVPCPITAGWFTLPIKPGTRVEFALHVGLECRAPEDSVGAREVGDLWFNDAGRNYQQTSQ